MSANNKAKKRVKKNGKNGVRSAFLVGGIRIIFTTGSIAMSKGQLFRRLLAEKPFIVTPGITNALHALNVSLAAMRTGMKAFWDYAVDLGERGAAAEMEFEKVLAGHAMSTFHDFAGFAKIRELEEKYLPPDEINMRYEKSQGR